MAAPGVLADNIAQIGYVVPEIHAAIRFFKEKLDELPADLVAEVQRRNTRYIVWLAGRLLAGRE